MEDKIVKNGKYYLYRWIRIDKNEPFYVGIGTKQKGYYSRLFDLKSKNKIFKDIINKSSYYNEIILESNNYDFIKNKEKEFIKLYGRIDLKNGILSNMTDGGEGVFGIKRKSGINHVCSKRVYQYDLNGNFIKEWYSISDINRELNFTITSIARCCRKERGAITYKNFIWRYNLENNIKLSRFDKNKIKIDQYNKEGIFIKTWNSGTEAGIELNISNKGISKSIKNNILYKNYYWTYHNNNVILNVNKLKKKVIDLKTGIIYDSIKDLAKDLGKLEQSISEHIRLVKKKRFTYFNE